MSEQLNFISPILYFSISKTSNPLLWLLKLVKGVDCGLVKGLGQSMERSDDDCQTNTSSGPIYQNQKGLSPKDGALVPDL